MNCRALGFALLCLLAASNAWAAVTFDAATSSACNSCTSLSWSHTTAAGSDRLMIVGVQSSRAIASLSSATYNSVAVSGTCSEINTNGNGYRVYITRLLAPSTGTNTVEITMADQSFDLVGGAVTFTGVHQTTPVGTCATATGTSTTPSVTPTVASDEIAIDSVMVADPNNLTVGSGQTQRWNDTGIFVAKGGGSTEPGPNPTMSWTTSSVEWVIAAVGIKPASGSAPSGPAGRINLMGVGK